ncbi:hypothetical protein [Gracilimonas sp. BCB1]|uniref:hypothetical protein n=1 Tax=Gracilimonas sp. BCB1 TaxID=3152362 RepID=UPI0032D8D654
MKIINLIFLSLFLVFTASCSNSLSDDEKENEEDLALKSEIEGQWELENTIRTFNADGTYSDSTIQARSRTIQTAEGEQTITYTVCDEEYDNEMYLEKVVQGTYEVKDGILRVEAANLVFACNPIDGNVYKPYFDSRIAVEGRTLNVTQARVFNRGSSGSGLEGTWETNYTAYLQSTMLETGAEVNELTEKVIFAENSNTFQQVITGYPTGEASYEMEYEYNAPELNVNSGNDSWDVEIDGDTMTWIYNSHTEGWAKVQ